MAKKDNDTPSVIDALLRVKTLENILIAKGVFTREEYAKEMEVVTRAVAKTMLQRANVPGDPDEILDRMRKDTTEQN